MIRRALLRVALVVAAAAACHDESRPFTGPPPDQRSPYDDNAWGMNEGKRLFAWYNCNGCHANGGGGMGPALMDGAWRYGPGPEAVYESIMEGRPNGMPAFRDRLNDDDVWKLVAYVRSMAGLANISAAPGRLDSMAHKPPEQMERPK